MSDAFKKVQRGQPLSIPAEAFNAFLDAANDLQSRQQSRTQETQRTFRQTGIVRLKNGTDADQERFAVLGIDQPIFTPDDRLDAFRNEPMLVGVEPKADDHAGRYAILLEPLRQGAIGNAVVAGVSIAKVDVKEECHAFAEVAGGQTQHLRSASKGSAVILWKESGTGVKWAVVRIAGPDAETDCDTCPEEDGSCAFEARFVAGSETETEWVVAEEGCAEDCSCAEPETPPTPEQAAAGEWLRTCCEPAQRDQGCGASCRWVWDGLAWSLDGNPCPDSCPCESPAGLAGATGESTQTPCGAAPPGSSTECGSPTTMPPECVEENCGSGKCRWVYANDSSRAWILLASDCENACCQCTEPGFRGLPCEETTTFCRPRYGPGSADCGGECQAYFNYDSGTWISEGCPPGCRCEHAGSGEAGSDFCPSPMARGHCVANPCQGGCQWSWTGSDWALDSSECIEDCLCPPPGTAGSAGAVARTCCGSPPPTPTTTTPTTTTTTTTTTPNCCEIFARDPYISVCSPSNKVVLSPQEEGVWTGMTLLPCGDPFGARVECTPSAGSDCSGFKLTFNMPCAQPPIFEGTIVECHCAEAQNPDLPPPENLFIWMASTFVDVSGCGCCGDFDPSTTTPPPG